MLKPTLALAWYIPFKSHTIHALWNSLCSGCAGSTGFAGARALVLAGRFRSVRPCLLHVRESVLTAFTLHGTVFSVLLFYSIWRSVPDLWLEKGNLSVWIWNGHSLLIEFCPLWILVFWTSHDRFLSGAMYWMRCSTVHSEEMLGPSASAAAPSWISDVNFFVTTVFCRWYGTVFNEGMPKFLSSSVGSGSYQIVISDDILRSLALAWELAFQLCIPIYTAWTLLCERKHAQEFYNSMVPCSGLF